MNDSVARTGSLGLKLPIHAATAWLLGTYGAFLLIGQSSLVRDMWALSIFVLAAAGALWLGYWLSARRYRHEPVSPPEGPERLRSVIRLTRASAIYLGIYGLSMLVAYGAAGAGDIIKAVLNPGNAYLSKFDVYQQQQAESSNSVIQILTLASVLYVPVGPLAVIYWKRLYIAVRVLVLLGVGAYAAYYLFIGTTKGLGDLAVFALVGLMVRAVRPIQGGRQRTRRMLLPLLAVGLAFGGYMTYSQADRITSVGGLTGKFAPNPAVETVLGTDLARGLAVVGFYPTHGYLGLSYNLDTTFEWSEMRGGSRAIDSYFAQYGFGDSMADTTYPARTEVRTGWPQGMYWATAYPWLASDLTFPGVVALMFVLGWWWCRLWVEAVYRRSTLALLLFAQLTLFIAYIPANNQIGISRPATIGFVTTIVLYAVSRYTSRVHQRRAAEGGPS